MVKLFNNDSENINSELENLLINSKDWKSNKPNTHSCNIFWKYFVNSDMDSDMNNDGEVNVVDVVLLVNIILGEG